MANGSKSRAAMMVQFVAFMAVLATSSQARSVDTDGVIPSPNQEFGDEFASIGAGDLQRMGSSAAPKASPLTSGVYRPVVSIESQQQEQQAQASNEASVPIYISPFNRAQRGATIATPIAPPMPPSSYEHRQESSHAPPNYAPTPASAASSSDDLKTSASYGKFGPNCRDPKVQRFCSNSVCLQRTGTAL